MTSKELIEELYKERAYVYEDKVCHKGEGWKEAIDHYDNIGKCLKTIKEDLEVLDIFKKHLIIEIDDEPYSDKYRDNSYLVNLKETDEDFYFTSIYVTKEEKELLERWLKGE